MNAFRVGDHVRNVHSHLTGVVTRTWYVSGPGIDVSYDMPGLTGSGLEHNFEKGSE